MSEHSEPEVEVMLKDDSGVEYACMMTAEEIDRGNSDQTYLLEKIAYLKANTIINNMNVSNDESTMNLQSTTTDENELTGAFKWPNEAILLLIEEYRKRADDFCSGKVSQKKTWQAVSVSLLTKGYVVTGPQCLSKFSGLKRTYKSIKDHNNKSGNGPRTWMYFDTMDSVIGTKPYMKPIATISSTGVKNYATNNETVSNVASETLSSEPPRKKLRQIPTVDKVVLAIEQNKKIDEENRERRHREKMEQKKEALDLLSRLVMALEK